MSYGLGKAFQSGGRDMSMVADRLQQIIMANRQKEQQRFQNELGMADAMEGARATRVREGQADRGLDQQDTRIGLEQDRLDFTKDSTLFDQGMAERMFKRDSAEMGMTEGPDGEFTHNLRGDRNFIVGSALKGVLSPIDRAALEDRGLERERERLFNEGYGDRPGMLHSSVFGPREAAGIGRRASEQYRYDRTRGVDQQFQFLNSLTTSGSDQGPRPVLGPNPYAGMSLEELEAEKRRRAGG